MVKKKQFVRFGDVKSAISIEAVLRHYGILDTLKPKTDGFKGSCPFHGGNPNTFHVSTSKNLFNCFGCGRGGNILDFVMEKEEVSLPKSAELLAEWFDLSPREDETPRTTSRQERAPDKEEEPTPTGGNKPLSFAGLKNLEVSHEVFSEWGFAAEIVEYFGAGFCRRGIMKDRAAVPIHDLQGVLLAYVGISPEDESYLYPKNFNPSLEVYNAHRAAAIAGESLLVAPDIWGVWRLYSAGYTNAVCLLGDGVTADQERTLRNLAGDGRGLMLVIGSEEGDSQEVGTTSQSLRIKTRHIRMDDLSAERITKALG